MMIKDRMAARPSKTNLRFIQKSKKAFSFYTGQQRARTAHTMDGAESGPLGENKKASPNAIVTGRSHNFFLVRMYVYFMASACASALPIDHPGGFLQRAVPFATTSSRKGRR